MADKFTVDDILAEFDSKKSVKKNDISDDIRVDNTVAAAKNTNDTDKSSDEQNTYTNYRFSTNPREKDAIAASKVRPISQRPQAENTIQNTSETAFTDEDGQPVEVKPISSEKISAQNEAIRLERERHAIPGIHSDTPGATDYVPTKKTVPIEIKPEKIQQAKPFYSNVSSSQPFSTKNISADDFSNLSSAEKNPYIIVPPQSKYDTSTIGGKVKYAGQVTAWFFKALVGINDKSEDNTKKSSVNFSSTNEKNLMEGFTGMFDKPDMSTVNSQNSRSNASSHTQNAQHQTEKKTEKKADVDEILLQKPANPKKDVSSDTAEYVRPVKKDEGHQPLQPSHAQTALRGFTDIFEKPKGTVTSSDNELTGSVKKIHSTNKNVHPLERSTIDKVDLNIDGLIIPNTSEIAVDSKADELAKQRELEERRANKIKNFVLIGDEAETDDESADESEEVISEMNSFDDASSVLADITQTRTTLLIRSGILILLFLTSFYISVTNDFNLATPNLINKFTSPTTYLFVNSIIGVVAGFFAFSTISAGFGKLISLKPDGDSIASLGIAASLVTSMITMVDTNLLLIGSVQIFISIAIGGLLCNTIGKLLILDRIKNNLDYVCGDNEKYAVNIVDDDEKASQFTRGTINGFPILASMRKTEFAADFLKMSYAADITDGFSRYACPVILIFSLIISVLYAIAGGDFMGGNRPIAAISAFSCVISLCSCFSVMFVVNLPLYNISNQYGKSKGIILGYPSIDNFSDTNSIIIDAAQLFPQGMVNVTGIKVFSDTRIDEAILEAASLASHAGSVLKGMFFDIIGGKTEMLSPVESYIYEDSMGICGWINNKRVLLGSRELMLNHSIVGLPSSEKENEYCANGRAPVYLSISGELSALFIIDAKSSVEVENALYRCEQNGIYLAIRCVDAFLSVNRISELFDISPEIIKLIPFRLHESYIEQTSYTQKQSAPIVCNGKLSSFTSLIIATKKLRITMGLGIALLAASIVFGILLALILTVTKAMPQLTATIVFAFNFIFTALTVLIQCMRKH